MVFINMEFLDNIIKKKTKVFRNKTYVLWIYIAIFFTAFNFNDTKFPIKPTLPSGVAPRIKFSELITRPNGSTTALCPLSLYNFHIVLLQLVRDSVHRII